MKKNSFYTLGSLIILLICAFVFVILPAFTGSSAKQEKLPSFGKYNGKEIRYEQGTDFADFVSHYGQMFQSYGQQMDSSTYYYVFNYAFNSTVMKMAYTDEVKKAGYKVPKTAVNRQMLPYFNDENGKYSSKIYKQTPAATVASIKEEVEESLLSSRFYDDNFGSQTDIMGLNPLYGLKESNAELDFLNAMNVNKRGFNMAVFPLSDYPAEEKLAYGKNNAAKFVKYDLSAITITDESTAKTVAKRLANEEITFEDAISEYSEKNFTNTEGKLTYKYQYQIENMLSNKENLDEIAKLSVGAVSSIIQTTNGYTIFKCDAELVQPDFEASEIVDTISSYMNVYETSLIEDFFTAKAKDFTSAAMNSDFAAACTDFAIENVTIEPFPLNYGSATITHSVDTSVKGLANADTNENFLKTAFSLKLNEISAPIVMNNNVIVIQYTTENTDEGDDASISEITTYDESSTSEFIMNSPKLVNNFAEVYYQYLMN